MPCRITGEKICMCPKKNRRNMEPMGSALLVDMKSALRKVFTDHAWYTGLLIIESLPIPQPNAEFVANRLMRNPQDIYDLLLPIVGEELATPVRDQFKEHLSIAASLLPAVREGNEDVITGGVRKFYNQGDILANALYNLSPEKLRLGEVTRLIHEHNEHVVTLATLRKQEKWEEYLTHNDDYYRHMLMVSDALYGAL